MLEVLGKGYVIESCISLFKKNNEQKMYKIYVTDTLYCIANTLRNHAGGEGKAIEKRFYEIAYPVANKKKFNVTEETEEDIIDRIKEKLGKRT